MLSVTDNIIVYPKVTHSFVTFLWVRENYYQKVDKKAI